MNRLQFGEDGKQHILFKYAVHKEIFGKISVSQNWGDVCVCVCVCVCAHARARADEICVNCMDCDGETQNCVQWH